MSAAPRKRPALAIVLVIVGIAGIVDLIERPRMQTLRAIDAVQFVASLVCLGIALALLIAGSHNKPAA
jgi:hypothetical protein